MEAVIVECADRQARGNSAFETCEENNQSGGLRQLFSLASVRRLGASNHMVPNGGKVTAAE